MEQDTPRNFIFINFGSELEIEIDEDHKAKCPKCGRKFKLLMQHINKSTVCKQDLDYDKFNKEYDAFKNRRRQRAHCKKELKLDPTETRNLEANKKRMQRERKLLVDAQGTRSHEASEKRKQRQKLIDMDAKETRKNEAAKIRMQRERKLSIDADKTRSHEATEKRKQRQKKIDIDADGIMNREAQKKRQNRENLKMNITRIERLKRFKRAVMFGPIFTCSCCHVNHFESNVSELDKELRRKILTVYEECFDDCVKEFVKININGKSVYYFCKTCIGYMKSKKIPPMSVCNGLDVVPIDDQELQLSELENNLIALRIMFQKICYLPKSRWTALKDRVINIPIEKESIINTIQKIPRLPTESGLVEIKLKRKITYKNDHRREFVDPNKIFESKWSSRIPRF